MLTKIESFEIFAIFYKTGAKLVLQFQDGTQISTTNLRQDGVY